MVMGGHFLRFPVLQRGKMAEKQLHPFDLNVNVFESNGVQPTGESSEQKSDSDYQVELVIDPQRKRKRHTHLQIRRLEEFFTECPNPDNNQRKTLGLGLGLEPLQVKFWFQNKRTQMKAQHDHEEHLQLRAENTRLKAENATLKETLKNIECRRCGGPLMVREISMEEHQLRLENARLRQEIKDISALAANYTSKIYANWNSYDHSAAP